MNELYHYGIKGQRWGVRRYQNQDGTLTATGKKHYSQITKDDVEKHAFYRGHAQGENSKKVVQEYISEKDNARSPYESKKTSALRKASFDANKKKADARTAWIYAKGKEANKAAKKEWRKAIKESNSAQGKYNRSDLIGRLRKENDWKGLHKAEATFDRVMPKKYREKTASGILKDLGYSDTAEARKYLIDNKLIPSDSDIRKFEDRYYRINEDY